MNLYHHPLQFVFYKSSSSWNGSAESAPSRPIWRLQPPLKSGLGGAQGRSWRVDWRWRTVPRLCSAGAWGGRSFSSGIHSFATDETQRRVTVVVKKKRKPRQSFLEQVQYKWSLKTPPLRENFPWEVQECESRIPDFQPQGTVSSEEVSSERGDEKSGSVSGPVSNRLWVRGNGPRKKLSGSESSKEFDLKDRQRDQPSIELHEHWQKVDAFVGNAEGSDDLMKKIILDEKTNETCSRSDEIQDKVWCDEESKDVTVVTSSTNFEGVSSKNCSVDKTDHMRMPWESTSREEFRKEKPTNSNTELAERLIPQPELKRLRNESLRMMERIKVGAAGVTQVLVDAIREKWKDDEVVKLKFEGPPSMNMKRTHKILESRTGGLVIWRSGSLVVLYRGMTYKLDCVKSYNTHIQANAGASRSSTEGSSECVTDRCLNEAKYSFRSYDSKNDDKLPAEDQMDISELNLLLDELGPRFTDWSGREPIPVDADLLPAIVPGYKTPFRLLPHGIRPALRDREMTHLRRTARTLPPHFALGRSRDLQGLATAMVKLWEKSAIAKIAIKRGVQNTSNERMAEELKKLTGGTLVSRNKEFIVFYRGNDFLPPHISTTLIEAEKIAALQQDEEDQARDRAATLVNFKAKTSAQHFIAGTLTETLAATSRWGSQPNSAEIDKMMRDAAVARHASLVDSLQQKLALAKGKVRTAEKALQKVLENQEPEALPTDLETLTDEERFLLRRIGLTMKPYLLLGRREIFDGTIENMHLHWKYREVVKIMVKRKSFTQVKHIAVSLEAESGGVLVSVDKTAKGYVIIVYRGKNYQRPLAFRPRNLLTKRQALVRSIELQRREGLKYHVMELEERVEKVKQELEDMMTANNGTKESLESNINGAADDQDA